MTERQQKLLDEMKAGARVGYMPYAGNFNPTPYYFLTSTMRRCTREAKALLEMGLVEKYKEDWRGHWLRIKQ